jgi:hypothetical protein
MTMQIHCADPFLSVYKNNTLLHFVKYSSISGTAQFWDLNLFYAILISVKGNNFFEYENKEVLD